MAKCNNIDFISVNEHWLSTVALKEIVIDEYKLIAEYCRTYKIHGGVGIYSHRNLSCTPIDLSHFCLEVDFEVAVLRYGKLIVVSVYRSPSGSFDIFMYKLSLALDYLFCQTPIIVGDFNVHFDTSSVVAARLTNLFLSYGLYRLSNVPTRGNSCLDTFFSNIADSRHYVQIIHSISSDHLGLIMNIKTT